MDNSIRKKLRNHPEYTELDILGEKKGFLLTMWGVEVANNRGYDLVPIIVDLGSRIANFFSDESAQDVEVGSKEFTERVKNLIRDEDARALSLVVWWGLVTFDTDLTLEDVQLILTPGTVIKLIPHVIESINKINEDELEDEFAEQSSDDEEASVGEEDQGKAQGSQEKVSEEPVHGQDTNLGNTTG